MPPPVAIDTARAERGWWVHAFGPWYLTVYGHRDEEEARRNAPTVARLLALPTHGRVLDLACGEGRYARALSALGYRVTGLDLSPDLLELARSLAADLPGSPTYLRGDMRDIPFGPQFDGVASLFTSFGYFDDRAEDARVLEGVARCLVPGGRFLLDFLNAAEVRANLVEEEDQSRGPFLLHLRRSVDDASPGGPYVRKAIEVTDTRVGRVVSQVVERVRLYAPDEIDRMLADAGLVPVDQPLGDFDGRPFDASSPRFIRTARRPLPARPR